MDSPALHATYDTSWSAWWAQAYRWDGAEWVLAGESTEWGWAYNFDIEFTNSWQGIDTGKTFGAWVFDVAPGWYAGINYVWDSRDGQWEWGNPQSFREDYPYYCPVG